MSEKLEKILNIDYLISTFDINNSDLSNFELRCKFEDSGLVDKALKLLSTMNNNDIIESFKRSEYLYRYIDYSRFFKKIRLDKKKLKEENSYLEEYKKLEDLLDLLILKSKESIFSTHELMDSLDFDSAIDYLLTEMSNDDIMELACESTDWEDKLFFYAYLKV